MKEVAQGHSASKQWSRNLDTCICVRAQLFCHHALHLPDYLETHDTSFMPVLLYRTSCGQRKTTGKSGLTYQNLVFSESKVQTWFHFYKLAKLMTHARFLTASQQRFRNLDVFWRQHNLLSEPWYSLNLSNSSQIPGPQLGALLPFHSPLAGTPMAKTQRDPSAPLDSCCHTGWSYLQLPGPKVTDSRVTLTSHARVSLDHNHLGISKIMLASCPKNIKANTLKQPTNVFT